MKAIVAAFNQEKALVGAFSVIVQPVVEPMDRFAALSSSLQTEAASRVSGPEHVSREMQTQEARVAPCTRTRSEDSVATCDTSARVAACESVHSLRSVQSRESRDTRGSNGDICGKGGYGYRFDFRSSCEFEFTEDVYI